MAEGKYFFARSKLSGKVLDVQDNMAADGQQVSQFDFNGGDNQLWFVDSICRVIRSKLDSNYVLATRDNMLVLASFDPGDYFQRWQVAEDRIQHADAPELVLDIADHNPEDGALICAFEFNGGPNQLWEISHLPAQYGYLVSQKTGKVIDVDNSKVDPGTKLLMWDKHSNPADNQLWYEDKHGFLCSKLNEFTISTDEGDAKLYPYDPDQPGQQWVFSEDRIVNVMNPGQVLKTSDTSSWNGSKLEATDYTGNQDQLFSFEIIY